VIGYLSGQFKMALSCLLRISCCVLQANSLLFSILIINPLLAKLVQSRWLDIGLFFAWFWTSTPSQSINMQKERTWSISSFIIWLAPRAGKMKQILRRDWLPEQARWSYLARSGLPAVSRKKNFPEICIINPLLTKLVRSRWLDISLVLFLRVYGP